MELINTAGSIYLFFLCLSLIIMSVFYFLKKIKIFRIHLLLILPVLLASIITIYTYLDQYGCNEKDIFDGHTRCYEMQLLPHISFQIIPKEAKTLASVLKIIALSFMFISIFKIFLLIITTQRLYGNISRNYLPGSQKLVDIADKINKKLKIYINFREADIKINFTGVMGLFRPVVVIPKDLISELNDNELEAIMYHEAGHVINKDNLVKFIIQICNKILFFAPFKDDLYTKWDIEREISCDKLAVLQTTNPLSLASALIKTSKLILCNKLPDYIFSGLKQEAPSAFKKRIEQIKEYIGNKNPEYIENKETILYKPLFGLGIKNFIFFTVICIFFTYINLLDFLHCSMELLLKIAI